LKPPKAKEANKFMILNIISPSKHTDFYEKYTYIETFLRNCENLLAEFLDKKSTKFLFFILLSLNYLFFDLI
jgi:hypothetical protein